MSDAHSRLFALLEREDAAPVAKALQEILNPSKGMIPFARAPYRSLPSLCCQALGGDPWQAGDVTASWEILYLAAYLLDFLADEEGLENHRGLISTLASACIPAARMLLAAQIGLETEIRQSFLADFDRAILSASTGQVEDLVVAEPSLEKCWAIARKKTGEMYALAARCGARLAGGDPAEIDLLSQFGLQLGILVQIGDDINGLWSQNSLRSDLACGKWTLPVAYAMEVLSPADRERLRENLRLASQDKEAEAETRREIIDSGALLYLAAEAECCRSRAEKVLTKAVPPVERHQELLAILSQTNRGLSNEI